MTSKQDKCLEHKISVLYFVFEFVPILNIIGYYVTDNVAYLKN